MNISSVNTTTGYTSDKASATGQVKTIAGTSGSKVNQETAVDGAIHLDEQQLTKSVERVIKTLDGPETTVERSVHEGTNHILYKIKDKNTGEVIREIPEEKLLDMAAKLMELNGIINGILIDEKV